jgi:PAS domain S-box-containing protein
MDTEQSYIDFVDNVALPLFRTTLEGHLLYCNQAFAEIFGFESVRQLTYYPVIQLYRNPKDRGALLQTLLNRGRVDDLPMSMMKQDGTPLWIALTAKIVFDDDGTAIYIDGGLKDITGKMAPANTLPELDASAHDRDDIILTLDLQGTLIDMNTAGIAFFGLPLERLKGQPLRDFIDPKFRDFYVLYLADVIRIGREEAILTIKDKLGQEYHIEFSALLMKAKGKAHHIKVVARNVTQKLIGQQQQLHTEKFRGVLEMAGGVAHQLNQPLTIMNQLLDQVLPTLSPRYPNHKKIVAIHAQLKKVNEIAKKINNIRKYESMEYVAGHKIVDIDKAATTVSLEAV